MAKKTMRKTYEQKGSRDRPTETNKTFSTESKICSEKS